MKIIKKSCLNVKLLRLTRLRLKYRCTIQCGQKMFVMLPRPKVFSSPCVNLFWSSNLCWLWPKTHLITGQDVADSIEFQTFVLCYCMYIHFLLSETRWSRHNSTVVIISLCMRFLLDKMRWRLLIVLSSLSNDVTRRMTHYSTILLYYSRTWPYYHLSQ